MGSLLKRMNSSPDVLDAMRSCPANSEASALGCHTASPRWTVQPGWARSAGGIVGPVRQPAANHMRTQNRSAMIPDRFTVCATGRDESERPRSRFNRPQILTTLAVRSNPTGRRGAENILNTSVRSCSKCKTTLVGAYGFCGRGSMLALASLQARPVGIHPLPAFVGVE